ncbi:MAG: DUF2239 family protein [Candidatus Obscuribacterales bacterium]
MTNQSNLRCTSFAGFQMIATGDINDVLNKTKRRLDEGEQQPILVFDDETSEIIEIDFRGSIEAFEERLKLEAADSDTIKSIEHRVAEPELADAATPENAAKPGDTESGARGRGRPKLGVVAREVTLLPRHWDWLNEQPGGASVALRKLVEEAKRKSVYKDQLRAKQNATYKFMSAMAGNLTGFEEATRALFAQDGIRFEKQIESWPADIQKHLRKLANQSS